MLAVGISSVDGAFDSGSAIEVRSPDGELIGKGLARVASSDLLRMITGRGAEPGTVVVHRDDLVVLAE